MEQELLGGICPSRVGEAETGQGDAREAAAESLQRSAARDRLGHSFCQFIKFVVHNYSLVLGVREFLLSASESTAGLFASEAEVRAYPTCTLRILVARMSRWPPGVGVRFVRQSDRGQHDARDSEAEFLQRPAARHRLGHLFS